MSTRCELKQAKCHSRRILGPPGRLLSRSKNSYRRRYPQHVAIFNAYVCLEDWQVWLGDLDLTLDQPKLHQLARLLGQLVYVLNERDGSVNYEGRPRVHRAVAIFDYDHAIHQPWMHVGRDGQLRRVAARQN
jgi:hypothetical protein